MEGEDTELLLGAVTAPIFVAVPVAVVALVLTAISVGAVVTILGSVIVLILHAEYLQMNLRFLALSVFHRGASFILGLKYQTCKLTEEDGGGNATGVKIDPIGFLVIKDGCVRMVNVTPPASNAVDRIIDLVPQVIDRVDSFIEKQKNDKAGK